MANKAENAGRRGARINAKNQVTIPILAMAAAGLRAGDRVRAEVRGRARVLLLRQDDPVGRHAGRLSGVHRPGELDELREEWG